MSRFDWLPDFLERLAQAQIAARVDETVLAPARCLEIAAPDWGRAGRLAAIAGCRFAAFWGDARGATIVAQACLEHTGDYLVLRTSVPLDHPDLPSLTPYYPAADRPERHARDLLGLAFIDHPDARRWTRHQAWSADRYPLRADFPVNAAPRGRTQPDADYPFVDVSGSGVYEIPVGPVHAGIIEPGHFRFQAVGEEILRLEQHLGYAHKGIEKLAVGRDPEGLARLAARVSGDSTVAHAWAACQAMERAAACTPPPRALHLRALLAERERVANHVGDIGAICNDVSFSFGHYQCGRLRELWQRRSQELFGHRFMMDCVVPGGVAVDLASAAAASLHADHAALRREIGGLFNVFTDHPSLDDRLLGSGRLKPEDARRLGAVGYVGKASGQGFDVRRASPYAPYDGLTVKVPVLDDGDVAARMRVRMDEIYDSLALMDRLLDTLPSGPVRAGLAAAGAAEGIGFVEGWRGEIVTYVRLAADGRVARYFPRDPSWLIWPALPILIAGNIVPDFPLCNKSVNGSYSGHDL